VIYLLFCWTLVPALIAFVEAIIYLAMPARVFDQKYNAGAHPAA
jgi:TM2 domain-containing membrane protein YozV